MTQIETSSCVGAVIIGRNEGDRLIAGLVALRDQTDTIIYVDSGSTDGSPDAARRYGADVIDLDMSQPFTAARARNTGLARLRERYPEVEYVQFIDGDCELQSGWLTQAKAFLDEHNQVAVVCGRRRERFPDATVYNRLIDIEWNTPIGVANACGGDALMRVSAISAIDGYNGDLIAGEEPELCVRLRAAGWTIWRIDAEMTLHDAALSKFSQWWKRNKRAGHAYAEGRALHGAAPEYHGVRETRSALVWGAALPAVAIIGTVVSPWSLVLFLAWPLQVLRLARRYDDWPRAFFLTLGKLPEAQGMLEYFWNRARRVRSTLIEYK